LIELDACRRVLALLSDYLDDDLAPEARAEAEAHLEACGACACTAAELAATIRALQGLREAGAPSRGSRTRAATTWRSTAPPSPGRSRPSSS
jgi:anti-sigma factor RsiW